MPLIGKFALDIPLVLSIRAIADGRNDTETCPKKKVIERQGRAMVEHDPKIANHRSKQAQGACDGDH